MKILHFNHAALHVIDVAVSVRFYAEILQLKQLPRPAFDFDGAWFDLGMGQELHLIEGRTLVADDHNRGDHLALRVDNLDEWESYLEAQKVPLLLRKIRPDGAGQLFIYDPDGHVIELCTPPSD